MALLERIWEKFAAAHSGHQPTDPDNAPGRLTRPEQTSDGPYADLPAIRSRLWKHIEDSARVRWSFERNWFRLILYYIGNQWITWDQRGSRWREKRLVRKWVPKPVTNRFASTLDSIRGALESFQVRPSAWPSTTDTEDIATAEVADRMIPVLEDEMDMPKVRTDISAWMTLNADAFVLPYYDHGDTTLGMRKIPQHQCALCGNVAPPEDYEGGLCPNCGNAGATTEAIDNEGNPIVDEYPVGRLRVDVFSPLEMYLIQDITNVAEHRSFCTSKTYTLDHIEHTWPEVGKQVQADKGVKSKTAQYFMESLAHISEDGGYFYGRSYVNRATIYRYVEMPSEHFPMGLAVTMASDDTVLEVGPSPFFEEINGERRHYNPLIQFPYMTVPGRLYSKTPGYDLFPKQDQLNRLESLIEMAVMKGVYGSWILPTGSSISNLSGEPAQLIRWTPTGTSGHEPKLITGNPVPQVLLEWKKMIESDFEELSGCLLANTRIPCLDGHTRTMQELAEESCNGRWVYGWDVRQCRVIPSQVEKAWKTGVKHCIRVAFEEGTYLDCTDDHPFLTWDRGYVRADQLRLGEPLIPLIIRPTTGYLSVVQLVDRKDELVHRMVAHALLGLRREKYKVGFFDVHHKDENRLNNDPANLEVLTRSEHAKKTPSWYAHFLHPDAREEQRKALEVWKQLPEPQRWKRLAPMLAVRSKNPILKAKWKARLNHRVSKLTPIGMREVYDLQTTTENFGVQAGVFVHNSYDALKGTVPRGVSAGYAIQLLTERAYGRFAPVFANMQRGYVQLYRIALRLARQYMTEERVRRIRGTSGQWQIDKFKGADLTGSIDIKVEGGAERPRSKLAEQALIQSLTQMGYLNSANPHVQYTVLEQFSMQHLLGGLDEDKRAAAKEWETFLKWTPDPNKRDPETNVMLGGPVVKRVVDNHLVHIMDHQLRAKTDQFDSLEHEQQMTWQQHIEDHMTALAPPAPPKPGEPGSGQAPPAKGTPAASKANESGDKTMDTIRQGGQPSMGGGGR